VLELFAPYTPLGFGFRVNYEQTQSYAKVFGRPASGVNPQMPASKRNSPESSL